LRHKVVLGDLALVAEIDPYGAEDVGHLGLEDCRIGVDQPVNAILLHQFVPVVEVGGAFDPARRSVELLQHGVCPRIAAARHALVRVIL
jgi:hypothetical protein